jgi:uncharacterized protein
VVRDRSEGVGPDGTVVTGAGRTALPSVYRELVEAVVAELTGTLREALHSVYVYGSVATGQARAPRSDLDLVTVLRQPAPVAEVARRLSDHHRAVVREVAIGSVLVDTLARDDAVGAAERCFLRHYCVHLAGPDLRQGYEPCRASIELAVGFNGDLGAALDDARGRLTADEAGHGELEAKVCGKILMAAATLLSAREGGWSTDRGTAVTLIGRHAPQLHHLAVEALARSAPASADPEARRTASARSEPAGRAPVTEIIDRLGGWLVAAYDAEMR